MELIDLLITNARVWTQAGGPATQPGAAMAIQDGRIVAIDTQPALAAAYTAQRTWDAGGKWLLPGLVNTHCHLFQTFVRGLGKDRPFLEWVHQSVRLFLPVLDEEAVYLAGMVGCLEALRTGTTTLVDFMYANVRPGMADAIVQAFRDSGIRGVLARGLSDVEWLPGSPVPSVTYAPVAASLAEFERLRTAYAPLPRLSFMLAPNVVWGMTREGLAEVAQYAAARQIMVTMHVLETPDDDLYALDRYGVRTTQLLEEAGLLNARFLAVHAIRLEPEDLERLTQHGVGVSHNPVANMILGSGVAPIPELIRRGVALGLGTDGAASNDSQSLLEVMKTAALLQKVQYRDPTVLSASQVFAMATSEGARAIRLSDQIGSLAPGMRADILAVDFDQPNTTPCYDPIASLVYSGSAQNIHTVFIDGQCVLDAGHSPRVDEVSLLRRANELALALHALAQKR